MAHTVVAVYQAVDFDLFEDDLQAFFAKILDVEDLGSVDGLLWIDCRPDRLLSAVFSRSFG